MGARVTDSVPPSLPVQSSAEDCWSNEPSRQPTLWEGPGVRPHLCASCVFLP